MKAVTRSGLSTPDGPAATARFRAIAFHRSIALGSFLESHCYEESFVIEAMRPGFCGGWIFFHLPAPGACRQPGNIAFAR
jgi:hypothetical protein